MIRSRVSAPGVPGALAAPVGGAASIARRCRGCRPFFAQILTLLALGGPLHAQDETVPVLRDILPTSGLEFTYHDVVAEPPLWRVRYVVPALDSAELSFEEVAGDIELLCTQDALRRVIEAGGEPATIVITLMSEPVDFGVMTPDVTQFFESFFIQSDLCIWEAF
ncbi:MULTISPECIES: DUF6497 family protein [unclassified Mameliella]|uniref:DUF6497 family protein n=1 Tax=unclassified Mameliella TaxID=2630630 RepID=UPI00273EE4C6|nr:MULTISPECIES: DUF6497 family protein [unclassified Mameliella]